MNREADLIAVSDATDAMATSTTGRWLALSAALLGWMFDGAEMGVFSLVGRPAVKDLLGSTDEGQVGLWFNVIMAGFLVGAATGGVVFGWLGDRIGRVRAMTLSVLVYAVFTGLCGVAAEAWQVGVLRFIAALGMGGEWSLGVALVMEVWPNRSRAFMAGLIGAAANVGYLMVGVIGLGLIEVLSGFESWLRGVGLRDEWVTALVANSGWRLMMLLGTLPALLTFFIRIFVPESEKWQHEQQRGVTSNWATRDLSAVLVGVAGPALIVYAWAWDGPAWLPHSLMVRIVATLAGLAIATAGYTYPVIRFFQRQARLEPGLQSGPTLRRMLLGACLSGVALLGTWGSTQQAPSWADKMTETEFNAHKLNVAQTQGPDAAAKLVRPKLKAKEYTLIWLSIGAIIGTIGAALAGDWLGRRPTYFLLCLLSLGTTWALFLNNDNYGPKFLAMAFVAGVCTASFYGWLPLYLPELFRTSVRATGQGFGFNFGRILAAIGVLQVGNLLKLLDKDVELGPFTIAHGHPVACSVICLIYLVGMVVIWFCPETKGRPLPE
jgi:MFS family permease